MEGSKGPPLCVCLWKGVHVIEIFIKKELTVCLLASLACCLEIENSFEHTFR